VNQLKSKTSRLFSLALIVGIIMLNMYFIENIKAAAAPTTVWETICYENISNGKWCCYCKTTIWTNGKASVPTYSEEICSTDYSTAQTLINGWCHAN